MNIKLWLLCLAIGSISCNKSSSDNKQIETEHISEQKNNALSNKNSVTLDKNINNIEANNNERPKQSIVKTSLDTSLLFSYWAENPNGSLASFALSKNSFYAVDYKGEDGDKSFELIDNKLKIYYSDFIEEGEIVSVFKDSLKIKWSFNDSTTIYQKWRY